MLNTMQFDALVIMTTSQLWLLFVFKTTNGSTALLDVQYLFYKGT
jgi:hypothetical protein